MKNPLIAVALMSCTACGSSGFSTPIDSLFVSPDAQGRIPQAQAFLGGATQEDPVFSQTTNNGYAFDVGIAPDDGIRGWTGLIPDAAVTAQPGGSAEMSGGFNVAWAEIISASSNNVRTSSVQRDRGTVALVADFDAGTLRGARVPRNIRTPTGILPENELRVPGQFAGEALTGTVTYNGVTGPLEGIIGGNEAVGVFHGTSRQFVHAGGFIVNPDD